MFNFTFLAEDFPEVFVPAKEALPCLNYHTLCYISLP